MMEGSSATATWPGDEALMADAGDEVDSSNGSEGPSRVLRRRYVQDAKRICVRFVRASARDERAKVFAKGMRFFCLEYGGSGVHIGVTDFETKVGEALPLGSKWFGIVESGGRAVVIVDFGGVKTKTEYTLSGGKVLQLAVGKVVPTVSAVGQATQGEAAVNEAIWQLQQRLLCGDNVKGEFGELIIEAD
jgi:hypothetical protein